MSAGELEKRIAALEVEIGRAREAIKAREATKSAAARFLQAVVLTPAQMTAN